MPFDSNIFFPTLSQVGCVVFIAGGIIQALSQWLTMVYCGRFISGLGEWFICE
jgi:hypothetical protein